MATIVEFRTGVDDKVAYATRWLRKAATKGVRVQVIGPVDVLQAIDRALWVDDPQDFVPHAWVGKAAHAPGLERTALWLGDGSVPPPAPTLLLNVGADVPTAIDTFERVIEVVATDPADAGEGRQRWKAYLQRGLAPAHRLAESGA
jgi:DNA polymerase III subunit chi